MINMTRIGYENIQLQTTQLSELPASIASLESTISAFRAAQEQSSTKPSQSLPLAATRDLLESRKAELEALNNQLAALQQAVPRKMRELERLEHELKPLEVQKAVTISAAKEARRRKEECDNGMGDDLELQGRWYRSAESGLREILKLGG
jgi:chromosome segregation ATPase